MLIKVLQICDHRSIRLHFEPLKLLNFDLNADLAPIFSHSNADPDQTFHSNTNRDQASH
jgi:hypothetical protein